VAFGLHPNAEIAVKTTQAEDLFTSILLLQPRDGGGDSEEGGGVISVVADIISRINDMVKSVAIVMADVFSAMEGDDRDPYQNVFVQESERMNTLAFEIRRSLSELKQGLDGELQVTARMEALQDALFLGKVPTTWSNLAYPSERALFPWIENLLNRFYQLQIWVENPNEVPKVCNISLFFNPQSFLTAIMQKTAQRTGMELDKLGIATTVTRKTVDQTESAARNGGAYISGLFLEGARWNWNLGQMEESVPREMFFEMPVIACHAILVERMEKSQTFFCPVYKTQIRGPTYVFTANLRSKAPQAKWILAGVTMVMEIA
jgi:dynein heavy chain